MADDTGPLTVEAATALIAAPRTEPPRLAPVEAPAEAAPEAEATDEIPASPTEADDASEADAPGDDVDTEDPPAAEAPDAPKWWDAEKKAIWATLSPEQQTAVADQEAKRETVVQKAKAEAAQTIEAAKQEAAGAQQVLATLGQVVPKWADTFKSRWADVDWVTWAREDPGAYIAGKAQMEAEQAQLAHAYQMAEDAKAKQHQAFLREELAKLPTLDAELGDPEKGGERRKALGDYLVKGGVHPSQLDQMDAVVMAFAHKAMKYDQIQASLKAKPQTPPQRPALAPTAQPGRTSQQRSVEQLNARLNKSGSVDDAIALMRASRK